jgi:tripartite-type tricarboxylate transporter receptor subunit TctC
VQTGKKRDPRMTDVPTMNELFDQYKTPDVTRRLAQVLLAGGDLGRPMMVTPGTPPDRIKILRAAYEKAMKDPELLREAEKGKMDVDPTSGEELEALVRKTMDQPKEVLARVRKMLEN